MPQEALDPQAVALAKAIRKTESNDNFTARGKTGEFGAYQYMPNTWKQWSKQYLGRDVPLEQATPQEQNEVAYKKIKELKDRGFNVGQIASSWNAGEGKKDAYLTGHKGVNSAGVGYDTGLYAQRVATEYQKFKGGAGGAQTAQTQQVGGYAPPPEVKPFTATTPTEPEKEKGLGRKALEFLFPILEDKERTGLQTLGDLGLSALTLVPGLGAAGLGAKAAAVGGKAALKGLVPAIKGANMIKGGAVGYGTDVLSNLSEGETGSEVLTPGLGTGIGVATGGLLNRAKGTQFAKGAMDEQALDEALSIVAAPSRKANVKSALTQGLGGRSGLLGSKVTLGADTKTRNAAESIKDLVRSGKLKAGQTVEEKANTVRGEIGKMAEDLEFQLNGMEIQPIITAKQLQGLIKKTQKKFAEDELLVGDAGETAKRIFNKFIKYLPKGRDITAIDILKARKSLDAEIRSSGRGRLFDPKTETAISTALREIRQGANDLLADNAPDVAVKESLKRQSQLYDALDAIAENGWREVGTNATGRFLQRHPFVKEAVKYGAYSTAGTAGLMGLDKLTGD